MYNLEQFLAHGRYLMNIDFIIKYSSEAQGWGLGLAHQGKLTIKYLSGRRYLAVRYREYNRGCSHRFISLFTKEFGK